MKTHTNNFHNKRSFTFKKMVLNETFLNPFQSYIMFCVKNTVPDLTDPPCYKLCYFIEVLTEIKAKNKM